VPSISSVSSSFRRESGDLVGPPRRRWRAPLAPELALDDALACESFELRAFGSSTERAVRSSVGIESPSTRPALRLPSRRRTSTGTSTSAGELIAEPLVLGAKLRVLAPQRKLTNIDPEPGRQLDHPTEARHPPTIGKHRRRNGRLVRLLRWRRRHPIAVESLRCLDPARETRLESASVHSGARQRLVGRSAL
jgi:hypothetical protein